MPASTILEIVPLGGLGEFGMNLMVYRLGRECLVVDAGMMFPGAEHLGVDVVIPNLSFLDACGTIHGVVLTHGHEDHIGSLPFLLARHDVPVWGTPYTLELVASRLREHGQERGPRLRPLPSGGEPLRLGPFEITALPVAHSIPQSVALVLRTEVGTIVHTADFKLDPFPPDGVAFDLGTLARLGDEGVLALLCDSTNAERAGFTPGENTVGPALEALIAPARGRVFVTTFSSNIHRIQQVADIAARHGRSVTLLGASMIEQAEIAERLGLLRAPAGTRVLPEEAMGLPSERALFLVTGSQGEPLSALARLSVDRHREARIEPGDLVLHSARVIPGNDKSIGRLVNHLLRRGAEVVTAAEAPIHVSGHPASEELRTMLRLLHPRFLIPIHGEYRQLLAHAKLGREAGMPAERVVLAESGDVIAVDGSEARIVDRVAVGQVFIDETLEEVDTSVLRDRRHLAGDGIVVPVVAIHRGTRAMNGTPEVVSRGFLSETDQEEILREAGSVVAATLADASDEERTDETLLKARIQSGLKRFLRKRTQRRPLIIPVIVEL